MRRTLIIGIILLVLGILGFTVQRVSFLRTREVLDVGPVSVETTERKTVPIPDIAAGAAVVAGIVLIIVGAGSSSNKN